MDNSTFWQLIDEVRLRSPDTDQAVRFERLQEELRKLPPGEVASFQKILEEKLLSLYREDLWAIAYIINGGCSDDGFKDFRSWIITQGRHFYESALRNAEYISDSAAPGDFLSDEFLFRAARAVYQEHTGDKLPISIKYIDRRPEGQEWDESDLPRLFPRAWKKFVNTHS